MSFVDQESVRAQEGFGAILSLSPGPAIEGGMRFITPYGAFDLSYYAPGVLRFQSQPAAGIDYGLLAAGPRDTGASAEQRGDRVVLSAGDVTLEVMPSPVRFRLLLGNRPILESVTDEGMLGMSRFPTLAKGAGAWQMAFALRSGEPVYGLGEKFGRLNHRGELITSWNYDATGVNAERSYKNMPFAWSPEGWGLFVNTPGRVTHAVGYAPWSHRSYVIQVEDPVLDVFLITGADPAQILERFTQLTGRSPLPPQWSYGVWMGRAFYRTEEELLEAATELRTHEIPCDVMLLDGRAWHRSETRFDFSWDPERYPDPAATIARLKDLNLRLCLWEYPYISTLNPLFNWLASQGFLLRQASGEPFVQRWLPPPFDQSLPHLQPSGIIDFTNPDAYNWFRDQHRALFEIGVAVMKPDYGEAVPPDVVAFNGDSGRRLHNVYALLYNRCIFEATEMYAKGSPVVWSRAGWTGSQRYPVQWGGDPQGDWEGLAASVRGGLSWGMSGVPFYAHDIGGFYASRPPAPSSTSAGCRPASSHPIPGSTASRRAEPWLFGEEAEGIVRSWLRWRYRLLPYLQACALKRANAGCL